MCLPPAREICRPAPVPARGPGNGGCLRRNKSSARPARQPLQEMKDGPHATGHGFRPDPMERRHANRNSRMRPPSCQERGLRRRTVDDVGPDIVHCATPQASFLRGMASSIAGIPVRVMTLHGIGTEAVTGRMRPVFHFLERLTCRSIQRIYCVGGSLRSQALESTGAHRRSTRDWPGGPATESRSSVFRGLPMCSVARTPSKRLRLPARSTGHRIRWENGAVQRGSRFDCGFQATQSRLAGFDSAAGRRFENYERLDPELYAEITQDPQIVPTGFLEDAPAVYSLMNVLSLPSYREGYGYVLMEAAAMQVRPSPRESLVALTRWRRHDGHACAAGNVNALTEALRS